MHGRWRIVFTYLFRKRKSHVWPTLFSKRFQLAFTASGTALFMSAMLVAPKQLKSQMPNEYWQEQGIKEQEISSAIADFINTSKAFFESKKSAKERESKKEKNKENTHEKNISQQLGDDWQRIIVKDSYQVWRKPVSSSSTYKYKVFGAFNDISPRDFFIAQMDMNYRKQWDELIERLEIVDREKPTESSLLSQLDNLKRTHFDTGNEVIQWIMHYPSPMYCREYCYVRRALVLKQENLVVIMSKACQHPLCDENSAGKYVRVNEYESQMVIRPHKSFNEHGFDFYLTYYDNPKAYMPMSAYNWVASYGLPDFVNNLHKAALNLPAELKQPSNPSNLKKQNTNSTGSSHLAIS